MSASRSVLVSCAAVALIAFVTPGCRQEDLSDRESSAQESAAAGTAGARLVAPAVQLTEEDLALPATFEGAFRPGARDDERVTVTLRPDGRFLLREGRVEERLHDRGQWYLSDGGRQLVLVGGTVGPRKFAVESPQRLRMLNNLGEEIDPDADLDFQRAAVVDPIEESLTMQGMFSYMADAALFTDCLLDLRFPVAQEADYLALERAYLGVEHEPGEAV
ncbi:MAG TPA: hypothetical protein VLC48_07295, partial [Gemmatimonadota bacterium]|nr:hypothetical protein [Gemmatimonadota bacterium]